MRAKGWTALCVVAFTGLAACDRSGDADVGKALDSVNAIDENNLSEIMLTVADPEEAVSYFRRTLADKPDRVDLQRGLARSLVRAGRATEGVAAYEKLLAHTEATNDDRVAYADALIRNGDWKGAEKALNAIPPTHETFERYRIEAMIADTNKDWKRADSFYETAVGLTTRPAPVLNNWGYSKLSRGDFPGAEKLFIEAISKDPSLFTAKNNLVLARGAQRNYTLPLVAMTQIERAQLLHTLGLAAVKQGDTAVGKGLLEQAVDTHPQHFEPAVRALAALQGNVRN